MSTISAMPADIALWLSQQEALEDIRFITEYPPRKKEIPLKSAVTAVGIDNISIRDSFTENDQGVLAENEYCRLATIRIRLAIHVPFSLGGARCYEVFTDILDCLTFASDLEITDSGCRSIDADRDTDALVLKAWIEIASDFCPAVSSSVSFGSFLNKELLCGSHITDDSIHVTSEDKTKWNAPFICGSYFGTGSASRTIDVGFRPALVVIFGIGSPVATANFSDGTMTCHWGCATSDGGTAGAELASNGFRVLQGASQNVSGTSPKLNDNGVTYSYIALK